MQTRNPSYYDDLEISQDATQDVIKKAYRKLVLRFHPDKEREQSKKDLATQVTQRLNEAYEVLSDTTKRARYDASLSMDEPFSNNVDADDEAIAIEKILRAFMRERRRMAEYQDELINNTKEFTAKMNLALKGTDLKKISAQINDFNYMLAVDMFSGHPDKEKILRDYRDQLTQRIAHLTRYAALTMQDKLEAYFNHLLETDDEVYQLFGNGKFATDPYYGNFVIKIHFKSADLNSLNAKQVELIERKLANFPDINFLQKLSPTSLSLNVLGTIFSRELTMEYCQQFIPNSPAAAGGPLLLKEGTSSNTLSLTNAASASQSSARMFSDSVPTSTTDESKIIAYRKKHPKTSAIYKDEKYILKCYEEDKLREEYKEELMKYIKERTLGERFKTSWFSSVLPSSVIDTVKGVIAVPDAYAKVEAANFMIDVLAGRTSLKVPTDKEKAYLAHLKSGDLGKTGDKAVKFAEETTSMSRIFAERMARSP